MNLQALLREKREEILAIARKHGAYDLRVFGSVSRNEADEASDIDILLRFEKGRSLLDHASLVVEMEDALGCKVDIVTEQGLKERIRARVVSEAVPI
jgi:uncharacterized protein